MESARTAGCANNLKQMGIAVQRFSAEHDGYLIKSWFNQGPNFPNGGNDWEYSPADWAGWDRVVLDYLEQGTLGPNGKRVYTEKSASICRCPADKTKGNVFSNYLVGIGAIPNSYRFNASMQRVGEEKAVKMVSIPSPSKLILVVDGVWKSYHHVRTDDAVDIGKISPSNSNNVATTRPVLGSLEAIKHRHSCLPPRWAQRSSPSMAKFALGMSKSMHSERGKTF
ncbi:MAG: DUF1559 domain-containing protein [Betaproteobacteria bacterium]|nr:DUF1559 domain-containing protein [Betaproteobacteria bacterium]